MITFSRVPCDFIRRSGSPFYLVTVEPTMRAATDRLTAGNLMMAHAVVDDFGNLVRVSEWF